MVEGERLRREDSRELQHGAYSPASVRILLMGTLPTISIKRIDLDCHWAVICEKRGVLKRFVSERQALQFKHVAEHVAKSAAKLRKEGKKDGNVDREVDPGYSGEGGE